MHCILIRAWSPNECIASVSRVLRIAYHQTNHSAAMLQFCSFCSISMVSVFCVPHRPMRKFGSNCYFSISARVRNRLYISFVRLEAIFSIDDHLVCLCACVRHASCVVLRTDVTDVATGTSESVDPSRVQPS